MYTPVIEHDVPFADFTPTFASLDDRLAAAMASIQDTNQDPIITKAEHDRAVDIFRENRATDGDLANPGVVVAVKTILDEYAVSVIESAVQIREVVTNKLLLLSDNKDPRIQLKALEMLGKISDVGLFTEKTEITMRHRPTEELEQMLRERLTKVIDGAVFETDHKIEPPPAIDMDIGEITGEIEDVKAKDGGEVPPEESPFSDPGAL